MQRLENHTRPKQDSLEDDYSDRLKCIYCIRQLSGPNSNRLITLNRCRNIACRIDMGFKAQGPAAYEAFRLKHDCIKDQRQKQELILDYCLPPTP